MKQRRCQTPGMMKNPSISALSYSVCDANTGVEDYGKNTFVKRDIASITKMMTCYMTYRYIIIG